MLIMLGIYVTMAIFLTAGYYWSIPQQEEYAIRQVDQIIAQVEDLNDGFKGDTQCRDTNSSNNTEP